MTEKEKLTKLLKKVTITGKTYTEYIEAIADCLISNGICMKGDDADNENS
jgi:hypothetical protein